MSGNGQEPVPGPDDYIDRVFGKEGYLAARFPGYQPRSGQVALARAIDGSLAVGEHLLAEGPTGVGKSLAYLVPATYLAARYDRTVVVATAGITLQEQLVHKDLPLLAEILPWKFTYGLLKGKSNFACLSKFYDVEATALVRNEEDKGQIEEIKAWILGCVANDGNGEGDMTELDFQPDPRIWREFSSSADECDGSDCQFYDECFAVRAQKRAREARVIVTNYHMLFLNMLVRGDSGIDIILPPHDLVIMDEVHKAPEIAREFFGFKISNEAVKRTAQKLKHADNGEWVALARASDSLFNSLAEFRRSAKYKSRLKVNLLEADPAVTGAWVFLEKAFKDSQEALVGLSKHLGQQIDIGLGNTNKARRAKISVDRSWERSKILQRQVYEALTQSGDNSVYFLETDEKHRTSIVRKPISVAGRLHEDLFEPHAVIATSATITTANDSFKYMARELGASNYQTLVAQSPFQWRDRCLFCVPKGIVEPNDEMFRDEMADVLVHLVRAARGRTLGLFTSYKNLEHAYAYLKKQTKYRLLRQGDKPRLKLIEDFKHDVDSVLLGTESFWAGVDVPGEALSAVLIDRLPFPPHDDPVMDALSEEHDNWFNKFAVPRSIIAFKQGFGRLIRSMQDRGVVVCCDNRIYNKGYGKQFLNSLPPVRITRDLAEVEKFFGRSLDEMDDDELFASVFE